MPALTEALPTCDSRMSPESPARAADRMKAMKMARSVRMPASRAAVGLAPMAYIERPYVVYRRTKKNTTTTAAKM